MSDNKTRILIGASGASVFRIQHRDGSASIEKRGPALEIKSEASVLEWCSLQAQHRIELGPVDEADFDDENLGRSAVEILAELRSLPPLPDLACFTHGDACLLNFLTLAGRLSGIVDLGRAGITHPAQDWALALRSLGSHFGPDGERMLRERLPAYCSGEDLLRRFRLLDECF